MNCPVCEEDIQIGENFCTKCGKKLEKSKEKHSGKAEGFSYASIWKRFGAYVIDTLIIYMILIPVGIMFDEFLLTSILLSVGYFTLMEQTSKKATLGKMVFNISVLDENGQQLSFGKSLLRNFVKSIFGYGSLLALFTKKQQALHDFLPKTVVMEKASYQPLMQAVKEESANKKNEELTISTNGESDIQVGDLSRKVKNGLANMPGITLMNDAMMSLSGVRKQMEYLKDEPTDPLNWLQYYECLATYEKMKFGMSWFRLVTNPASFVISKGISTGLNAADDEYEKFDPVNCLKKSVVLSHQKIESEQYKAFDIAVLAKAYFYLGINQIDESKKENYIKKSIQYLSKAVELEKNPRLKAEYFFYIGQFYSAVHNKKLQVKCLNLSRKLGFIPACEVLKQLLRQQGMPEEEMKYIEMPLGETHFDTFRLTYKPKLEKKLENLVDGVFKGQKEKIEKTKQALQSMK